MEEEKPTPDLDVVLDNTDQDAIANQADIATPEASKEVIAEVSSSKNEEDKENAFPESEDLFSEDQENAVGDEINEAPQENQILEVTNDNVPKIQNTAVKSVERSRLLRLPLARVKNIMKMDPDCTIVSSDAVIVACKAVELFLAHLGSESVKHTLNNKRKTVMKRDLETVIESQSRLCFLDGALE